jgi:hypothetical protein
VPPSTFYDEGQSDANGEVSMTESLNSELRGMLPTWLLCTLVPLPAIVSWRFLGGEPVAHFLFFACCMSLVASRFRPKIISQGASPSWHVKMLAVGAALISSTIVFSLLWLGLADGRDFVTPFIAFQAIIPSVCIVPYVTLLTRRAAPAVILSAFLVGCMKMVAGIVVNLREGWYNGNHELPWTNPNLMLWAFWVATAILSVLFLVLGATKYRAELGHVAVQQS